MRPIDRVDDFVANLSEMTDVYGYLSALKVLMEVWRLANIETLRSIVVTETDRNNMLRYITMFNAGIEPDLNCYPIGYNTTLLYDIDGNPVT